MSNNHYDEKSLKWAFDISAYRLIGRELITDKITAVYELVKNSYDANASVVELIFKHVEDTCVSIEIIDDGMGMSEIDISKKWMVIGSNSKRKNRVSPPPFSRKLVGKKGIGRFAIDKLGAYVKLETKMSGIDHVNNVIIDWTQYEDEEQKQLTRVEQEDLRLDISNETKLFTDFENSYWKEETHLKQESWTKLSIKKVRDTWDQQSIELLISELSKLASPFSDVQDTFSMLVTAPEYGFEKHRVVSKAIKFASDKFEIRYNADTHKQEYLHFDNEAKKIVIKENNYLIFGPIRMVIYYFDKVAKSRFKKYAENQSIDGIKIYRDGLITTPFAESVTSVSQKKDILGLDKRRWSGFFSKISSRDILGYIEISDDLNPGIIESTNRQGFLNNTEFNMLCEFFFDQLSSIEEYLQIQREAQRTQTESDLQIAMEEIAIVGELVSQLQRTAPEEVKAEVNTISRSVKQLQKRIISGIDEYKDIKLEKTRQENLFFSLMSLQEYAGEIAHLVRTSIAKISRYVQFFYEEYPNPKYDRLYSKYAKSIHEEMTSLNRALDFMLSYTKSNIDFESLNVKNLLEDLLYVVYIEELDKNHIEVSIDIDKEIEIFHNRRFFEDIFQNLIDNSIKALVSTKQEFRKIILQGRVDNDSLNFKVIDNGPGIPSKFKDRVFNIYFTTTAQSGGGGIGLFTVKKRIQAMNGSIEIIDNPYFSTGAAFNIILPFKK